MITSFMSIFLWRALLICIVTNVSTTILFTSSLNVPVVIKICHNKDCIKRGGGEPLLRTFRDLLPTDSGVIIESSGCLSQCGKGPNVEVVESDNKEKLYFGVDDPITASAVLDVATGKEYPINLLLAASSIYDAEKASSPSKKEELLNSAIEALSKDNDPTLQNSFARAHALYLRADTRLETSNIEGAVADATTASQVAPNEGRVWRVLACSLEADGRIKDAIDALKNMAKVDPSYSTKARNEIERLRGL